MSCKEAVKVDVVDGNKMDSAKISGTLHAMQCIRPQNLYVLCIKCVT